MVERYPPQRRQQIPPSSAYPTLIILSSLLLRLFLFSYTNLPAILERRIELSTPISSIRYLREGVYLHQNGVNAYEGGNFHHSPLYLLLFSLLPLTSPSPSLLSLSPLFHTLIDLLAALALRKIWLSRKEEEEQRLRELAIRDHMAVGVGAGGRGEKGQGKKAWVGRWLREGWEGKVMVLYLCNPYTIASCLARSTTSIDNALILLAISSAAQGHSPLTAFYLSLATHTSLYPILLLPPLILLLQRKNTLSSQLGPGFSSVLTRRSNGNKQGIGNGNGQAPWQVALGTSLFFLGCFVGMMAVGYVVVGDWAWVRRTWETILTVSDLTPNVGLSWYFFTEMFDHFRTFFTGVFQLHVGIYVVPLCIRLYDQPFLIVAVMTGIIAIFKSYPTIGDATVWLGLLGCFPDIWDDLRHPLLTFSLQLYSILLLPILHSLWLESGTGNANFFYAATLVYALGSGMGLVDMLGAGMRCEVGRRVVEEGLAEGVEGDGGDGKVDEDGSGEVMEGRVTSAKEMLSRKGLVVVQYASLDDD